MTRRPNLKITPKTILLVVVYLIILAVLAVAGWRFNPPQSAPAPTPPLNVHPHPILPGGGCHPTGQVACPLIR